MAEQSEWILEATVENFMEEVIERSKTMTVVVDFWSPMCQPCMMLMPIIEKAAKKADGKFLLAKVNTMEQPQIASQFGVQGIPFVVAMQDGQPVNYFQGLIPEQELDQWLSDVLPSEADGLLVEAKLLEESDLPAAEANYRQVLEQDPENAVAKIGLGRVLLNQDQDEQAKEILTNLEARGFLEPDAEALKSQLELREAAKESGGVAQARAAVEADPDDDGLKLKLADALAVDRSFAEACDICLDLYTRDKSGIGGEAKETLLKIFDIMGDESELASQYRRRLSTLMY